MSDGDTSARAAREQERRRAYQKEVPEHFCATCRALTLVEDGTCLDCDAPRPEGGWPALEQLADPWLGRVISDRYLVTKPIAVGANSRVYRADSRIIPRSFAIKFMDVTGGPNLDQVGLRRRLRREVEALSALRNPHIVGFYDVVELDDHVAFVMDLIDGLSLDEYVEKNKPLVPHRALNLVRQLANGVFEAHESGLIHRALKPSNVMVEQLPAGDDFVRILDFGVVWVRGTVATTGAFDESPVFSSPEQIRDDPTDRRTDLYSIGAIAYFLLTGRPVFEESTVFESVDAVLNDEPPTIEEGRGEWVYMGIERFVARLLAKNPSDRPSDLAEVIELLDDLIDEVVTRTNPSLDDLDDILNSAGSTSVGLIPTLGEASSPLLKVDAAVLSGVSSADSDVSEVSDPVVVAACTGRRYGFVRGTSVSWVDGNERTDVEWKPPSPICAMAQTHEYALIGLENGMIYRVSRKGSAEMMFQDPRQAPMVAVATDGTGISMVAGSKSGRLYAYRLGGGWSRLGTGDTPITALALNAKGDQFAVARGDELQVLNSTTTHSPTLPLTVSGEIRAVAFSPDDYLIAVLTVDGKVVLESVLTGQEFMRIDTGDPELLDVSFSDDNHLIGLFRSGSKVTLKTLT